MEFPEDHVKIIHNFLPQPVGEGKPIASLYANTQLLVDNPKLLAAIMAVGNRIQRGAIPYPLEDFRCSYCLRCHESTPMRCSRCQRVFYCNQDCQKKHWRLHKKVCGTVTENWDLEEWRHN